MKRREKKNTTLSRLHAFAIHETNAIREIRSASEIPLFFHVCFSLSLSAFCVMSNVRLFHIATMTISKQH